MPAPTNAIVVPPGFVDCVLRFGASEAARRFNMSCSTARRRARLAQVTLCPGRRRDISLAERNRKLLVMRLEGKSRREIAEAFGIGRERVRQILEALGGDPLTDAPLTPEEGFALGGERAQKYLEMAGGDSATRERRALAEGAGQRVLAGS